MNPRTKIKVSRIALLEAVKARQASEQAAYEAAVAKYEKTEVPHRKKVAAFLRSIAKDVEQGGSIPNRYDYASALPERGVTLPSKPRNLDAVIAQLEMAIDDVIAVSVEDFSQYIGSK